MSVSNDDTSPLERRRASSPPPHGRSRRSVHGRSQGFPGTKHSLLRSCQRQTPPIHTNSHTHHTPALSHSDMLARTSMRGRAMLDPVPRATSRTVRSDPRLTRGRGRRLHVVGKCRLLCPLGWLSKLIVWYKQALLSLFPSSAPSLLPRQSSPQGSNEVDPFFYTIGRSIPRLTRRQRNQWKSFMPTRNSNRPRR
jgi:hypothetical protein